MRELMVECHLALFRGALVELDKDLSYSHWDYTVGWAVPFEG